MKKVSILADGETLWEGEYKERKVGNRHSVVTLVLDDDDEKPVFMRDLAGGSVELSAEDCDMLYDGGVVINLHRIYPRADRYGFEICHSPLPQIWKATCGNLGFFPAPELDFTAMDSGDDSVGKFVVTLRITDELYNHFHARLVASAETTLELAAL